jgi:hypothetical protein
VILTTYLDESGTHRDSPVLIMGGIVGHFDQWIEYDRKWGRLRQKHLFTCFHSKEVRHCEGEFKNWSNFSKHNLVRDIDKHQNKNSLFRFVTVVNKQEFQEHYKSGQPPQKFQLDSIYGMCFRLSLAFTLELAERSIGLEGNQFNFIVEDGHPNAGACSEIVKQIKKHVPELGAVLGTCILEKKYKLPGLQGADAISYAGYLEEIDGDAQLMDFENDWNLDNAKAILRAKSPVFRSYGRPEIMKELKDNLFILEERRRQFGQQKRPTPSSKGPVDWKICSVEVGRKIAKKLAKKKRKADEGG